MPLRLVTWNIWQFNVPWTYAHPQGVVADYPATAPRLPLSLMWKVRRDALTIQLAAADADLILLQECAQSAQAPSNQARQLADVLNYEYVWQAAQHKQNLELGQAVLSLASWQRQEVQTIELPHGDVDDDKTRNALLVTLALGDYRLRLANVHLSLDANARLASVAPLLSAGADIIAGDFNEWPDGAAIAQLQAAGWRDVWATLHPHEVGYTFATPNLDRRIDYIFLSPHTNLIPTAAELLGQDPDRQGFFASDHVGLMADLDIAN